MKRRDFMSTVGGAVGLVSLPLIASCHRESATRPNMLVITADDLSYEAVGVDGCPVVDVTPHIDRLAAQGMRFEHSHATIAACQPSRSTVLTGLYPHHNGAMGFEPILDDVVTLTQRLQEAGYLNGILSKVRHLKPLEKFHWDVMAQAKMDLGHGRNPAVYGEHAATFFARAKRERVPFFLSANPQDPHRPFAGTLGEMQSYAAPHVDRPNYAPPPKTFAPHEVPLPGFLPDLPQVWREMANYYASVTRCDASVGAVLQALDDAGLVENTLVFVISDHAMGFPFAKAGCYPTSTRVPTIARWPGHISAGAVDVTHFISGIDFTPTMLEVAGVPVHEPMDGRSFLPVLRGEPQAGREQVFTVYHTTIGGDERPMRGLHTAEFSYIFNAWADGETVFASAVEMTPTFEAMQLAAEAGDATIERRLQFLALRAREEFYDLRRDPDALNNLIDDPAYREQLATLKSTMAEKMVAFGDPLLDTFRRHVIL